MLDLPRQLVERRLRAICVDDLTSAMDMVRRYADAISSVTFGGCRLKDVKGLVLPSDMGQP